MRALLAGGAGLVLLYTGLTAMADAITKQLAAGYAAPQMYALSGAVVVTLAVLAARLKPGGESLRTGCKGAMALRALFTVLATLCFFLALRHLPFAEVFLFIGMMPLISAALAGPILGERVRPAAWGALAVGFVGVLFLFPQGASGIGFGHAVALGGALFGTVSIMLSRRIGRHESNGLAQVFYPNLALLLVMGAALPFVWRPMPWGDVALAVGYGSALFIARWLLVLAVRDLAAHAVTSLMKLQFIWMVLIGAAVFGETPAAHTLIGASIVVISGLFLAYEDRLSRALSARPARA